MSADFPQKRTTYDTKKIMLVEFRVKNFLSIREEQVLSMVASKDKSLPDNVVEVGKMRLLKTAGIYGANASGKSSVFYALAVMRGIVKNSATYSPNDELPVIPFKLDDTSDKEPTSFEVTFLLEGDRYQYGFSTTTKMVTEEYLLFYPNNSGKSQTWIDRKVDAQEAKPWAKNYVKGETVSIQEKTRTNALFLSVGAHWNNAQFTKVFTWVTKYLRFVNDEKQISEVTSRMFLGDNRAEFAAFVEQIFVKIDFGIREVKVFKREPEPIKFPDYFPKDKQEELQENIENVFRSKVEFDHVGEDSKASYPIDFEEESEGTRKFFKFLGPWYESLNEGYCLFVDELAAHFHPQLTEQLVSLMQDPKLNKKGAQLIFTTHDTTLMRSDLLRRDQIWFTEKSRTGVTELYSLSEFKNHKARNNEAFQRGYLSGRYGALPIIQSFGLYEPKESNTRKTPTEKSD